MSILVEKELRLSSISKKLKCLVCEHNSVYDSDTSFAINIREFIIKELDSDKNDAQIIQSLKTEYGEDILNYTEDTLLYIYNFVFLLIIFLLLYKSRSILKSRV